MKPQTKHTMVFVALAIGFLASFAIGYMAGILGQTEIACVFIIVSLYLGASMFLHTSIDYES